MVGEFPELQGIMGGLYAKEQGEPEPVWKAVYSHYEPVGLEEDGFPLNREGAVVSLADKIDTLTSMFSVGLVPTGFARSVRLAPRRARRDSRASRKR